MPTRPELTRLLRDHLAEAGTAPDGRIRRSARRRPACQVRTGRPLRLAYSVKGLSSWTPASSKSLTLRVTRVRPCTRAVAAMSASITGRGCAYCCCPQAAATGRITGRTRSSNPACTSRSQRSRAAARCRSPPPRTPQSLLDLAQGQHGDVQPTTTNARLDPGRPHHRQRPGGQQVTRAVEGMSHGPFGPIAGRQVDGGDLECGQRLLSRVRSPE
jgi:hypothetical protein